MKLDLNHTIEIAQRLNLEKEQVHSAIGLLESGATIPFIARYRKDATQNLDEVNLLDIEKQWKHWLAMDSRKSTILDALREKEVLSEELESQIRNAQTLTELEDLYLPYKTKRKSRAEQARQKGLEPLAKILMSQGNGEPQAMAKQFVVGEVVNTEEALNGALDIVAEWINENPRVRRKLRRLFYSDGVVASTVVKGKEAEGDQFRDYFDRTEPVKKVKPHRMLAMFRGENEGVLRLTVVPDRAAAIECIEGIVIRKPFVPSTKWVRKAVSESYSRLLRPALQTELKNDLKEKADASAIKVFSTNLRQLLMAPPLGAKRVLAIDPGYKSGCKVVCLDEQGNLLGHDTIYPHPPQRKTNAAQNTLQTLVRAHKVEVIAVGNGTAGRETEDLIKKTVFKQELKVFMVNEDGASVYSASSAGRREFPNHDVTIRGAVSIGRRLMDPLAELVKIDPQSLGVGQYQHDVDEKRLKVALNQVVQLVVNEVGVELNTASPYLLAHISGLSDSLAEKIVDFRTKHGAFKSRQQLLKVGGLGPKSFEQCAGFLRITNAENPLDGTAVHPESYPLVKKMAQALKTTIAEIIGNEVLIKGLDIEALASDRFGEHTVNQVVQELKKPGRDPRRTAYVVEFDRRITRPEDLKIGSEMWGVVTNITSFGAFVDIGVKQDGLVHISELANRFVSDPFEVVKINQPVKVKVLTVDTQRKRIALSMKQAEILEPPV